MNIQGKCSLQVSSSFIVVKGKLDGLRLLLCLLGCFLSGVFVDTTALRTIVLVVTNNLGHLPLLECSTISELLLDSWARQGT